MEKIKVIKDNNEYHFENKVNKYLADGWTVSSTSSAIQVAGKSASGCYLVTNDIYVVILVKNSEDKDK